ncbi:CHASE2 domain-containing protein [bacterium M00.F.Ca.ET.228.01.1.1]|uniref:CHASE2 domain-containing protein n=1 Tax=Paraburkholderia phenoliruptrix TaxID=252970 RepID=UPI00109247C3|nr:CHASE2 domain-containing protein [Paraburkholderia phenoliruptrix]TGP46359.1 CHASE2 domain-containing protein [bacterium M00.F.Ca.ET.228.01.1.1]TGS03727.1 CHASE2 domain-containing protein [bacterium M00.F.Ca.ET.191.01.1.1]TGU07653.1 CHASE2 domain-containing protein [bacterium M00.F.Ca.ET.155.01.1.1]MBW0446224.1 CHASE2 domain-containing protein [Paraburkholderia phenoliruptrix]MBW9096647.1 CHASE2 domain-containing protein [Paraburkholderia phenoliruptrix]
MSRIASDFLSGTLRDWLVVCALLATICLASEYTNALRRADLSFLDAVTSSLQRPAERKVVLVAVDDATLKSLGGWPLKRSIYAAAIDRLTRAHVAAVGLDVAMTHQGRIEAGGDERLAQAMTRNARVITPVFSAAVNGHVDAFLPVSTIATASYGMAQVNAYSGADGVIRKLQLVEGNARAAYEHMSVSLLRASGMNPAACDFNPDHEIGHWAGGCIRFLPIPKQRAFHVVSLIDLLQDRVPAFALEGAVVIIGATSSLAGARMVGPQNARYPVTSAEFLATATTALASGGLIRQASAAWQLAFDICVVLLLCCSLLVLGPRASLVACGLLAAAACLIAFVLLRTSHVFVFPSPAVAACAVAYPLWSWRRQEALMRCLGTEASAAENEPFLPDDIPLRRSGPDPVSRQIAMIEAVLSRMRRYRHFISDWVDSLPEATLVTLSSGAVVTANRRTALLFCAGSSPPMGNIAGRHVAHVLRDLTSSHRASAFVDHALQRLSADSEAGSESAAALDQGIEIVDGAGRSLLIKCGQIHRAPGSTRGLVFHIADVTQLRMAERQRDITLRFLSHDMRSSQTAILSLVEHRRQIPSDIPDQKFTELIGQYASSSLSLADDFLFLAHAESRPPKLVTLDLALLLGDAIDDLWPHARTKRTTVRLDAAPGMLVLADVSLLRRAFANLISNAIKFGPEKATVEVVTGEEGKYWQVVVIDHGIGIPSDHIPKLFKEFVRLGEDRERPGHGLGLAFVKSVVDTLGGQIHVRSCPEDGTSFTVLIPKAPSADASRQQP